MVEARLVARDARVDLVGGVGLRLGDPIRIRQQRPGHRDQLHMRVGKDLLSGLRHVDAVGRHHRNLDVFGDGTADVDERAVGHRGDDRRHPRLVPAEAGVDHRRACGLDFGCQRDDLVPTLAVGDVVGHRHAVADDEVRPDRLAAAAHDLDRKPPAILGRTAPGVLSLVGARCEELVDQIAFAAHDLDTVVTRFAGKFRATGEVPDGAVDIPERTWLERIDRRLDRRRAHRERMVGIATRVQYLQQDLAALVVHGVGDTTVPTRFRRRHQLRGERQQPSGAVRRVTAGDDQADAAARPLGEVRGEFVGVARAVLQAGVHRAHHHPVAQRREPKVQRRQQVRVQIGHGFSFKLVATSSSHSMAPSSARIPPRRTRY